MKKLLLIMLASLFMMMACDLDSDDSSSPDYAGTWVSGTETYVFTDTTFTYTETLLSTSYEGTVSVSSDQLTFVMTELTFLGTTYSGDDLTNYLTGMDTTSTTTYTYSVDGDTLTLTDSDGDEDVYTKQ